MYLRSFSRPDSVSDFSIDTGADEDRLTATVTIGDLGDDGARSSP